MWSCPGLRVEEMTPERALEELRVGDIALGRFDVRPTIDGVDDGVWVARCPRGSAASPSSTARRALLASHDKLLTARAAPPRGLAAPARTRAVVAGTDASRHRPSSSSRASAAGGGTWSGCTDDASLVEAIADATLQAAGSRRAARSSRSSCPPQGHDLRVLVAGGDRCVGAIDACGPAPGEWRTNVSLGGAAGVAGRGARARGRARARCRRGAIDADPRRRRPAADRGRRLGDHRGERRRRVHARLRAREPTSSTTSSSPSSTPPTRTGPPFRSTLDAV